MSPDLVREVWNLAGSRCEYCKLPSQAHPAPFQIDHIIARQHGGLTVADNLALSCIRCNRYKGPNIAGIDPESRELIRLFHPRRDDWNEHFRWSGPVLVPLTAVGRGTIAILRLNDAEVVRLREFLQREGVFGARREAERQS